MTQALGVSLSDINPDYSGVGWDLQRLHCRGPREKGVFQADAVNVCKLFDGLCIRGANGGWCHSLPLLCI